MCRFSVRRFSAVLTVMLGGLRLTCGGGLVEAEVHDVCVEDPDLWSEVLRAGEEAARKRR